MADDKVTTALEEIRQRVGAIKAIRARWTPRGEVIGSGVAGEWVVASVASAGDVPDLLAAIDVVLAAHRITGGGDGRDRCARCRTYHGEREPWPCGEYQAISAALLGSQTGSHSWLT